MTVVIILKQIISYDKTWPKTGLKCAQKRAYKAPENAPKIFDLEGNILKITYCTKMLNHSLKASFQYLFLKFFAIFVALVIANN